MEGSARECSGESRALEMRPLSFTPGRRQPASREHGYAGGRAPLRALRADSGTVSDV